MNQTVVSVRKHPAWGIRSKVFSLVSLSVLLPTALVGTLAYWTARDVLTERLSDQLNASASLAASEIAEWFEERAHDASVFASAGVVAADLEHGHTAQIEGYLTEVSERQPHNVGLGVVDRAGRFVSGAGTASRRALESLDSDLTATSAFLRFDGDQARLWITSPIRSEQGLVLGYFVVSSSLDSLRTTLSNTAMLGQIRIVDDRARVVFTHPENGVSRDPMRYEIPEEGRIAELSTPEGARILAAARGIDALGQSLVLLVETDRRVAFAAVEELRQRIVVLSFLVAALVISLAYLLVVSLTKPLDTLTDGADAVSRGDYSVVLPVRTRDEIGYLTEVFNRMTGALRKTHETLETLSTTDELTKLVNRRQLRKTLSEALLQAERRDSPLSLLLIDIDHFKAFNDELGHLRGDELLEHAGGYLMSVLRQTDVAARYGGEEFLLVLPDTHADHAAERAEAIRTGFTESQPAPVKVTLSVGVATWPQDGASEAELIDAADRALYRAKRRGRNRVVVAGTISPTKAGAKKDAKRNKKPNVNSRAVH